MKKLLFLGVIASTLIISACKNDNTDEDLAYNLVGLWHPSRNIVISGSNGNELSNTESSTCVKQSTYNFKNDGETFVTLYGLNASNNCGMTANYQKNYTYDNVNNILIIGNLDYYEVKKITKTELQLVTDSSIDVNNDGVKDRKILVLNK